MKCPYCASERDRVVDSRESRDGENIRRRRECLACKRRFTSYERVEELPAMVIKKDGRREIFEPQKVLAGLLRACEKRPVSRKALEEIVESVSAMVGEWPDREGPVEAIGQLVMERLKDLDKVAYVRFASVYRKFEDVEAFLDELRNLLGPGPAARIRGEDR
ncbi:MAG: transcriptional regulator NrdR [Acidobacteriota bacterium]